MGTQRFILLLVFIVVLIASIAEIFYQGFSFKTIFLLIATAALVLFLWFRPENRA